ncbi:spermidine/putrescine transport system substrate-binding protein [Vibrio xiamenensis]|uniref:Putrescine-binding periplasmic protein n=1 Tax=Vibrio xiamenensis TaxID=861298 RepID=A0A1G8GVU6_9VIBR|nr:spermidine/putrescine ABC transporter substrate-binding protein [Vibrio xiamenensis]SDH98340.1 spermidine/putrescine transport system substrate-binding protein [Vibrio xiamenensis]
MKEQNKYHDNRVLNKKRLLTVALVAAMFNAPSISAQESLKLYNWGDYINPEVLTQFKAQTGIDVSVDTYTSNEEMLAKLQAGATGYDIVFPSVHMQDIMSHLGLLEKTHINQFSGFKHIDTHFLTAKSDPKGEYCLPYAWGTVGILYNKKQVKSLDSWQEFFNLPQQGKKIAMLDDMREVIGVGLIEHGKSVNSTRREDLKLAQEFILKQKPNVSSFTYDSAPLVQSGDIAAAQWYVGGMLYVFQTPDELDFVIPKEGATMYQENMCVLKSAPNKSNAKKFLEFFTQPEIAALNTKQQMNGSTNKDAIALLPDYIRDNPSINPPEQVRSKLQMFAELGKDIKLYDRVWTKIRTH